MLHLDYKFKSDEKDINELTIDLEKMIKRCFGFDIPIFCISQEELTDILQNTPAWWGNENKEIYNNLIFICLLYTSDAADDVSWV